MKTLTKAAISAAAVMAITTGTLAFTASAAVNASKYDLPQNTYSTNVKLNEITDTTPSVMTYSATNTTKNSGESFYCVNSNKTKITDNSITNGTQSSMITESNYVNNYKWCSVSLKDTEKNSCFITSLKYQNTPNAKTVKAVLSSSQIGELNGTVKEGIYVFSINDSDSPSAATLSAHRLWVTLKY